MISKSNLSDFSELENRMAVIEERNRRVESEKSWETSWTRKISVAFLTYLLLAGYFGLVLKVDPWINAFVPTLGFLLSTLTLSHIRRWWLHHRKHSSK